MRSSIFAIASNLVKTAVAVFTKDSNGYFRFGEDDKLPNYLINIIHASGTAKACVNRLVQFVAADGLIDRDLAVKKANPKQTFDSFISDLAINTVFFKAVGFRVLYDNQGQPSRFYPVFSNEIRRKGSYFLYNEYRGEKGYRSTDDKIIQEFNPDFNSNTGESSQARLKRVDWQIKEYGKQYGDLVFIYKKSIGCYGSVYGLPDYYSESAVNDIESDAAIARFDNTTIKKGFRTGVVISTGPVDDINKDEAGKTDKDYLNESLMKFTGEDAASILHLEAANKEEKAEVTVIPINQIMDAAASSRERIANAVCRHFNVPPCLIGISTAGKLGDVQEIVNQIKLMNMTVLGHQNMISEALKMVIPENDWSLSTLKLFDYIPDWVLQKLSDEELREIFELKPRIVPQTTGNNEAA